MEIKIAAPAGIFFAVRRAGLSPSVRKIGAREDSWEGRAEDQTPREAPRAVRIGVGAGRLNAKARQDQTLRLATPCFA